MVFHYAFLGQEKVHKRAEEDKRGRLNGGSLAKQIHGANAVLLLKNSNELKQGSQANGYETLCLYQYEERAAWVEERQVEPRGVGRAKITTCYGIHLSRL